MPPATAGFVATAPQISRRHLISAMLMGIFPQIEDQYLVKSQNKALIIGSGESVSALLRKRFCYETVELLYNKASYSNIYKNLRWFAADSWKGNIRNFAIYGGSVPTGFLWDAAFKNAICDFHPQTKITCITNSADPGNYLKLPYTFGKNDERTFVGYLDRDITTISTECGVDDISDAIMEYMRTVESGNSINMVRLYRFIEIRTGRKHTMSSTTSEFEKIFFD